MSKCPVFRTKSLVPGANTGPAAAGRTPIARRQTMAKERFPRIQGIIGLRLFAG
jgi:hypothetical protein